MSTLFQGPPHTTSSPSPKEGLLARGPAVRTGCGWLAGTQTAEKEKAPGASAGVAAAPTPPAALTPLQTPLGEGEDTESEPIQEDATWAG